MKAIIGVRPAVDNTDRIDRILSRSQYYRKFVWSALGRIAIADMLRSHFVFLLPDARRPVTLTVEFTNYCNLRCPYCTSPLGLRTRGFMSEHTFSKLVSQVSEFRIPRTIIVGNGESTLHPRFGEMVRELATASPYLHMVTNGQRLDERTIRSILSAPVRMLEISADSNERDGYERSRIGGQFERLLHNLTMLRAMRTQLRSPTLINITAMIRPSQKDREAEIIRFWRRYADSVMPQYLIDITGGKDPDVFDHIQRRRMYPRCTIPLRGMVVHWNGNVPLCGKSAQQIGKPDGLIVGNIHAATLRELWRHPVLTQYREGHRERDPSKTPICKGCSAG